MMREKQMSSCSYRVMARFIAQQCTRCQR